MSVIDGYLANVSPAQRVELERIRAIVKAVVPDAAESISYGMPAFKYKNRPLVYFAAFKSHLSLFPTSGPTEVLHEQLRDFKVSKGTIQFTPEKPLPESLIKQILQVRLDDIQQG